MQTCQRFRGMEDHRVSTEEYINPITNTWERKDTPPRRSPYDRMRVTLDTGSDSLTQQADKDRTDINNIVNHFQRTGEIPFSAVRRQEPQYGDVSNLHGFMDENIQRREEAIARLTELENDLAQEKQPELAEQIGNLIETLNNPPPPKIEDQESPE